MLSRIRHFCPETFSLTVLTIAAVCFLLTEQALSQSRRSARAVEDSGSVIPVLIKNTEGSELKINPENFHVYENGIEQRILNIAYDPSPSRIVLLADNSATVGTDVEKLKAAVMEFAYEIFEGDQLFVIAFDEKPEIIQEWTDDAKKIESSLSTFRKRGNPYLFDAISATVNEVLLPLMPGTKKTAIVVIGDGLDRGSKTSFDKIHDMLLGNNITVYFLQLEDRSGGVYRKNQPKASVVVQKLTEDTGGKAFSFDQAQDAAKFICDELRKNRYLLSYQSLNSSSYDARRLLLLADGNMEIRMKKFEPPSIKSN
jgi:Ca-activated chloride channel family protein